MNKRMRKYLPVLIILISALASIAAIAHTIPSAHGNYINDFAGVLSLPEKMELQALSDDVRKANGTELVVVVVRTIGGGDFDAVRVDYFNEQGIGQKANNNGVLILLATEDRNIGITTGGGMEGALPDSLCKELIDTKAKPNFTRGSEKWGMGLIELTKELVPYIKGEKFAPSGGDIGKKIGCIVPVFVLAFFIFIFALIGYSSRVRCPVCRGKVKLLKKTTVLEAKTDSPGLEKREFECTVCKHKFTRSLTTPALGQKSASGRFYGGWSSSSSGGWSSSHSSGGGFGGGSSGGGGASSGF